MWWGSQDYDSLLFGAPKGGSQPGYHRQEKAAQEEHLRRGGAGDINLEEALANLGITHKQLVEIGIMCGTDYNCGLTRVGPKTALKLIREKGDLEAILAEQEEKIENFTEIREFFLHPDVVDDYKIMMKKPRVDEIVSFLVEERDFDQERVEKTAERLEEVYTEWPEHPRPLVLITSAASRATTLIWIEPLILSKRAGQTGLVCRPRKG